MTGCQTGCCRTPFQVCAHNRQCWCHADDWAGQHYEHDGPPPHRDPTGETAINNIMRQRKGPR